MSKLIRLANSGEPSFLIGLMGRKHLPVGFANEPSLLLSFEADDDCRVS